MRFTMEPQDAQAFFVVDDGVGAFSVTPTTATEPEAATLAEILNSAEGWPFPKELAP